MVLVVSCDFKWPFENRHDSGAQKACFPSVFADFFTILLLNSLVHVFETPGWGMYGMFCCVKNPRQWRVH